MAVAQRTDHVVDSCLGHPDDRVVLGDLDRADLAAGEVALVGDHPDEIAGSDAGLATERNVDEPCPDRSAAAMTGRRPGRLPL